MDIVIITTSAQIVQRLLAHRPEGATPLVSCIVNDALVHSMPNLQQMLLLPFMIFNFFNTYH